MTSSPSNQQRVVALLKSIETGEHAPIAVINPAKYIQHNLSAADGLAGFAELMSHLPPGSARVRTARAFSDGDYVFTHNEYDFFGPKIGFDVFRFEGDQIVEHWDNLQTTAGPNPSGHSMIDGPTEATDLASTAANKALVRQFMDDIFLNRRMEKLTAYIDGEHYVQHNPQIGDGLSGMGAALQAMAAQGISLKLERVHQVLGQGSFVLAISEGEFAGQPSAFYDLFRVANGRLAEHWDVIEAIPARAEWKNANGKF